MPPTKKATTPPPVQDFQNEKEYKEQRLMVATIIMSGLYSNPCFGHKWYLSFFNWIKSLFGIKAETTSSVADYRQVSKIAIDAAEELLYHNETTPVKWTNNTTTL
jgi:hypothetical protein